MACQADSICRKKSHQLGKKEICYAVNDSEQLSCGQIFLDDKLVACAHSQVSLIVHPKEKINRLSYTVNCIRLSFVTRSERVQGLHKRRL